MKNHIILTPIIFLTLLFCYQCTVEKRLYNRGFHVERNRGFTSSGKSSFQEQSDTIIVVSETIDDLVEEITILPLERGGNKQTVDLGCDAAESATVSSQIEFACLGEKTVRQREPYTNAIQREKLIASGCLTALCAGASALCYLSLGEASTFFSALVAFLGWYGFMGLAVICGIAFLIYLIRPTVEDRERKKNSVPEERKFSKGERIGLLIAGIFAFVILLAFTLPLVNG